MLMTLRNNILRAFYAVGSGTNSLFGESIDWINHVSTSSLPTRCSFTSIASVLPIDSSKFVDGSRDKVAVGISGGVDSAVAAKLLLDAGHNVIGVFMRNWNESEETGNNNCSIEKDFHQARLVCQHLKIPLLEADFVHEYWNNVFETFLDGIQIGCTPNPDLDCNKYIKFSSFAKFARSKGIMKIATGHYARLGRLQHNSIDLSADQDHELPLLLKGKDLDKDQTYFLSSIDPEILRNVIFPIGNLSKAEVRTLALEIGLPSATRKSSTGICFIGKRKFGEFVAQYIEKLPGNFVDIDTGDTIGACPDIKSITYGQRPGIGGMLGRTYVVGKDMDFAKIYVAQGKDHPSLYTKQAALGEIHWLSSRHKEYFELKMTMKCQYKARYRQEVKQCEIFMGLKPEEIQVNQHPLWKMVTEVPSILIAFEAAAFAITPYQALVLYDGDICLGHAKILYPLHF